MADFSRLFVIFLYDGNFLEGPRRCNTTDKTPELSRRKMLAKDRDAVEVLLKLPTGDLVKTTKEALCIVLDTHFPGVWIKNGPEEVDQPSKIRTNSENWKKAN